MAKDFSRSTRIAELIQRELVDIIRTEVKDPRLGMVTILHLEVSKDIAYARVYVSVMQEELKEISLEILNNVSPLLRKYLGKRLSIRHIPQLTFYYDNSTEDSLYMNQLIEKALAKDNKKASQDDKDS